MEKASSRGYSTSLVKKTISSARRIASRETASSGAIHDGKSEVARDDFIDSSPKPRPLPSICAHDEASLTGGGVRRPRDGRRTPAALRGGSSERSDALAPAYGALHELAHAFSLKSTSEGNGRARFTKLVKPMLSGVRADERNPWCKGKGRERRGE
ncbi:hypothetical protein EDB83DRAFT_2370146 [Lactarius deliciosus]|nr:hypothetical protein EDB83DRAFT_2370146 [Lactarius deliciosus]